MLQPHAHVRAHSSLDQRQRAVELHNQGPKLQIPRFRKAHSRNQDRRTRHFVTHKPKEALRIVCGTVPRQNRILTATGTNAGLESNGRNVIRAQV